MRVPCEEVRLPLSVVEDVDSVCLRCDSHGLVARFSASGVQMAAILEAAREHMAGHEASAAAVYSVAQEENAELTTLTLKIRLHLQYPGYRLTPAEITSINNRIKEIKGRK